MIKHQNLLWNFFLAEHTNFQYYVNPILLNLQFLIRLNKIFYRSAHLKPYKEYVRKLYKLYALIFVCVLPYGIKNKFSLFSSRCPINFHLKKKVILQRFKLLLFFLNILCNFINIMIHSYNHRCCGNRRRLCRRVLLLALVVHSPIQPLRLCLPSSRCSRNFDCSLESGFDNDGQVIATQKSCPITFISSQAFVFGFRLFPSRVCLRLSPV